MKIQLDTSNLTRTQIGVIFFVFGISIGSIGGWYLGREALRNQVRNSIKDSLPGLLGGGAKTNKPVKEKNKSKKNKPKEDYTEIKLDKNEMDGTTKYTLISLSSEKLSTSYGSEYGAISVRCEGNQTDVIIKAARFLSSDSQTVKLRWDDGEIESEYMSGSTNGTALFSRSPQKFIAKASKAKKLVLQYTPWRATDEVAVYRFTDQNRKDFTRMQDYCN